MSDLDQIKIKLLRSMIDDEQANKLADALAQLESATFKLDDVMVEGIVRPELIEATFRSSGGNIENNLSQLVNLMQFRPSITIFPKGILTPDLLEIRARFRAIE